MSSTLADALEKAFQQSPELKELSDRVDSEIAALVRSGELTPQQATEKLLELADYAQGLLYQESPDHPAGLNPLYLAGIMERLQFDGDAPELRFQHMVQGGEPAVPVQIETMDPVALGAALERASEEVSAEFRENAQNLLPVFRAEWEATLDAAEEEEKETGTELVSQKVSVPGIYERSEVDPPGYRRGELPALRKVVMPTGAELAAMPPERKKALAWKSFSTTQGRRSAAPLVHSFLVKDLQEAGWEVVVQPTEGLELWAEHAWALRMDGPQATQSTFSPVATAYAVLRNQIFSQLEARQRGQIVLEIGTVDRISERQVGWMAKVWGRGQTAEL